MLDVLYVIAITLQVAAGGLGVIGVVWLIPAMFLQINEEVRESWKQFRDLREERRVAFRRMQQVRSGFFNNMPAVTGTRQRPAPVFITRR